MNIQRNDFVRQPACPEWGIGRVTEEQSEDGIAMICFPRASKEAKRIKVASVKLIRVEPIGEAVAEYHKALLESRNLRYRGVAKRSVWRVIRVTTCYNCKGELDSRFELECRACEGLVCICGACLCGYYGLNRVNAKHVVRRGRAVSAHVLSKAVAAAARRDIGSPENMEPATRRPDPGRDVARSVVALATPAQRLSLFAWAQEIIAIRESNLPALAKVRRAIASSANLDLLVPVLQRMRAEMKSAGYRSKRLLWDDRGWAARLALVGITVGSLGFGSQAAGIAALGRAVAVPLWLVLGAGGAFLGTLVDELADYPPSATLAVIEAPRTPGHEERSWPA